MRFLGVDPGLVRTGWAVVEMEGDGFQLLSAGVIAPRSQGELGERLLEGFDAMTAVLEESRAGYVALEELFSAPDHPNASLLVAHMRGVLCVAFQRAGVIVRPFTATTVKQRLTGSGHASKEQVRRMVFQLCQLPPRRVKLDLTDAIALAITGLTSERALAEQSTSMTSDAVQAFLTPTRGRRAAMYDMIAEQYPGLRVEMP